MKGVGYMPTMVRVQCSICQKEYEIELKRYNQKIKENSAFYCSSDCRSHKGSILCKCATCGKEIWRTKSQFNRSQTGNVYCSKSCANSMNNTLFKSGENHFAYQGKNYRQIAFELYEHKCVVCGYDAEKRILEVHHKDENHDNNDSNNLCILCPNCHRKISLHLYRLTDEFELEPIN